MLQTHADLLGSDPDRAHWSTASHVMVDRQQERLTASHRGFCGGMSAFDGFLEAWQ